MRVAGAYLESNFLQSVRKRSLGLFALIAIVLHVAVPTALQMAAPATDGLLKMVICSGGEAREVFLDKNGKPVSPATSDHDACKFSCLHHCAALIAATAAGASPEWTIVFGILTSSNEAAALHRDGSHPRAPPLQTA